jgi:hypothetical protein
MAELLLTDEPSFQEHLPAPQPDRSKCLLGLILITISLNLVVLGLNIGFIYVPELMYRSQVDQTLQQLTSVLNQTEDFIRDARPIIDAIGDMICSYDARYCPT